MRISKNIVAQVKRIPTRFDDITREIYSARTMSYYNQFKPETPTKTFKIGDIWAEKLNAIKNINSDINSIDKII